VFDGRSDHSEQICRHSVQRARWWACLSQASSSTLCRSLTRCPPAPDGGGDLDEQDVRGAARELLQHRRRELPSVSVALAAQLLGVSCTTVEAWKTEGVLVSAQQRLCHVVIMDDDLGELGGVLTAPACWRSMDDQEPRGWGRSPRSGPYQAPRAPAWRWRARFVHRNDHRQLSRVRSREIPQHRRVANREEPRRSWPAGPRSTMRWRRQQGCAARLPSAIRRRTPKIGNLIPVAVGNCPKINSPAFGPTDCFQPGPGVDLIEIGL
jgi:hypothetical protein